MVIGFFKYRCIDQCLFAKIADTLLKRKEERGKENN